MLQTSRSTFRRHLIITLLMWTCAVASSQDVSAQGPTPDVAIVIDRPEDVGLEGFIRPGTWAPMRLTIRNSRSTLGTFAVDWIAPDADGDLVLARRENVVVAAGGSTTIRLYAMPATGSRPGEQWTVRVIDTESETVVASTKVAPKYMLPLREGAIGVIGGGLMGLASFRDVQTQHEPFQFITGIDPSLLPDRWYGLRLLDAIVWAPGTGRSPSDPSVPLAAIKEWVRRGGHLVIILSSIDTGWSDPKVLDLLPPVTVGDTLEIDTPPRWLYETSDPIREPTRPELVQNLSFIVRPMKRAAGKSQRDAALIVPGQIKGDPSEPVLVAAHQYGFGRVTLIGLDITDRRMASNAAFVRYGLPRLWQSVFGWRSPGNLDSTTLIDKQKMVSVQARDVTDLGQFIPGRISMKTTATISITGAVILFGIYWVVAGPGMFAVLKARKMLRHSWLVFTCIVIVFSIITWSGAMLMRPSHAQIEHFSFVDIDASSRGPSQIRVHSYLSLFLPKHGAMDVTIDTQTNRTSSSTLVSPGLPDADKSSFVDQQQYVINALSPAAANAVPMRSTAKQFEAQYCEVHDGSDFAKRWAAPEGRITMQNDWPAGVLIHSLPGTLTNVRLIYCPGDGAMPMLWNPDSRSWKNGDAMHITRPPTSLPIVAPPEKITYAGLRKATQQNPKPNGWEDRTLKAEGILGAHMNEMGGARTDAKQDEETLKLIDPGTGTIVRTLEILSFFNMLPPPDFMVRDDVNFMWTPVHFTRRLARDADLSHLTATRRLIVLGHMEDNSPLPLPLKVDGSEVTSKGWTMVRFIVGIAEE